MANRVLISNGGYSEIPLIHVSKEMGYYTIVCGNNEDAPGNGLADKYVRCDYSDPASVRSIASSYGVAGICSSCSDYAYLAAGQVCNDLGLTGYDDMAKIRVIHNKNEFRKFARSIGIPAPWFYEFHSLNEVEQLSGITFPCLVKPVDAFGGIGITKCLHRDDLIRAAAEAFHSSRINRILVEEVIDGTDHGYSSLVAGNKVVFSFCDNEYHDYYEYAVSAVCFPSDVPESSIHSLTEQVNRICGALQLKDGLVHIQFRLKEDGTPVILEVCRRSPGDLYIEFVKYVTGLDYPRAILESSLGLPFGECVSDITDRFFVRQVILSENTGYLQNVVFSQEMERHITERFLYFSKGMLLSKPLHKLGVVFMVFDSKDEMEHLMSHIKEHIKVITSEDWV